jgi:DNA-binding Lrp family transcriptional regulator
LLDILSGRDANVVAGAMGRWSAYLDLVDSQLTMSRRRPPETLMRRTHVRDILERVLDGRARTQRDIQTQLHLKEANASRILKLMEQAQLIRRRKVGRENQIEVGAMAESARVASRIAPRGLDYLVARG